MWTSQSVLITPWWKASVQGRGPNPCATFKIINVSQIQILSGCSYLPDCNTMLSLDVISHNRRQKHDLRETRVVKRWHSFVRTPNKPELYDRPVCWWWFGEAGSDVLATTPKHWSSAPEISHTQMCGFDKDTNRSNQWFKLTGWLLNSECAKVVLLWTWKGFVWHQQRT